ncbi:MAG: M43 family zinc metalloprotease [Bacteroidota bacterium]
MTKIYCLGLALTAFLGISSATFAQDVPKGEGFNCYQQVETNKIFREHPEIEQEYLKNEAKLRIAQEENYKNRFNKDEKVYRIPVVFHVIHQNGEENITYEQIKSAIDVMNEEFNGKNPAFANIIAEFKDRAAECKIEFRLATIDPQGRCTNGVDRFYDTRTTTAGDEVKAGRQWPREKYLNVYTCATIASGAAGYAYYPGTISADRDGILIIHSYVGRIGTGSTGRQSALTHEVGHYMNLAHTWGNSNTPGDPGNCSSDDGVTDTPNCIGSSTCNLRANTCEVGMPGDEIDNIQNFMEYAYCYAMYTNGQKARMRAALESSTGQRNNLWTDANLAATGANYEAAPVNLCKADFGVSVGKPVCAGASVTFNDLSYNNVSSWKWTFEGGTPAVSTDRNPTVTYANPGTYAVTLEVSNGVQNVDTTKNSVVTILPNNSLQAPYVQTFEGFTNGVSPDFTIENPNNDQTWTLTNTAGYQSSKSVYIRNRVLTGTDKIDELISNTLDLSGMDKPHVKFRYAHARKSATSVDELDIYVSNDCGNTWFKRKVLKGTTLRTSNTDVPSGDFTPTTDDMWKETDVNIEAYNAAGVKVRFQWINGGGNNIYLDNINIYDAASTGIDENISAAFGLSVYPNPASGSATVAFELPKASQVKVELFDLVGKKCKDVYNGSTQAGEQEIKMNFDKLITGIYFVKLSVNGNSFTQKLIIQ